MRQQEEAMRQQQAMREQEALREREACRERNQQPDATMTNLSNKVVSLERMIGQLTQNFQMVLNHVAAQNQQPHRTTPAFGANPRFPAPTAHAMAIQQHSTPASTAMPPPPNYNSVPRQSQTTPAPHNEQRVEDIRQRLALESPRHESQALTQQDYVTAVGQQDAASTNPFATPYANANVASNNLSPRQETRPIQPDLGQHQQPATVTNPFVAAQVNADVAYHSQPPREVLSQRQPVQVPPQQHVTAPNPFVSAQAPVAVHAYDNQRIVHHQQPRESTRRQEDSPHQFRPLSQASLSSGPITDDSRYQWREVQASPVFQPRSGPVQAVSSNRKTVSPDKFDGKTPLSNYLLHFEMCASLNGWTDREMANYLAVSLRGSAQGLLNSLHPAERDIYGCVVKALKDRFGTEGQTETFKAHLLSRTKAKRRPLKLICFRGRRAKRKPLGNWERTSSAWLVKLIPRPQTIC